MKTWKQAENLLSREKHIKYYSDKKIKEIYYTINNKYEGEYKIWWDNGQLFKHCFYKNDLLDGEYKLWHLDKKLWIHRFYKNGI